MVASAVEPSSNVDSAICRASMAWAVAVAIRGTAARCSSRKSLLDSTSISLVASSSIGTMDEWAVDDLSGVAGVLGD